MINPFSCALSPPQLPPKAEKYSDWEGADDVTFNALISAFEKGRQWQLALHILRVPWMTRREWKETYTKPPKETNKVVAGVFWTKPRDDLEQYRMFSQEDVFFFAEKRYTFVVSFQL